MSRECLGNDEYLSKNNSAKYPGLADVSSWLKSWSNIVLGSRLLVLHLRLAKLRSPQTRHWDEVWRMDLVTFSRAGGWGIPKHLGKPCRAQGKKASLPPLKVSGCSVARWFSGSFWALMRRSKHNIEDVNKNGNIDGISSQAHELRMLTCQVTFFYLAFSML